MNMLWIIVKLVKGVFDLQFDKRKKHIYFISKEI
jgi:hypothetical protein